MKEVLYAVRCLKSNEDMILALRIPLSHLNFSGLQDNCLNCPASARIISSFDFVCLLDFVLRRCGVLHITEGYPLVFHLCAGCIPCDFYFCWTLSSDDVLYSTLQRDIL